MDRANRKSGKMTGWDTSDDYRRLPVPRIPSEGQDQKGVLGDPKARVIRLERRQKKRVRMLWHGVPEILRQQDAPYQEPLLRECEDLSESGGGADGFLSEARKGETGTPEMVGQQLLLYDAVCVFIGRQCRSMSIKDVAKNMNLDWHTLGIEAGHARATPPC